MLRGLNVIEYTHCVRVYETLCKPYLTAHLILMDNNNLIDNLGIRGGEQCLIAFWSPPNQTVYTAQFYVLQLTGHQSPMNIKTQIYDIDLVGLPYFRDKGNIVEKASKQETATDAIQEIWGQYLDDGSGLNIPIPSQGMIGQENSPTNINHKKPFAAIDELRKYAVFPDKSPSVFFRDRYTTWLWPFKALVEHGEAGGPEHYIQKETWGADMLDADIYRAIIYAEADVDKNFNGEGLGGRGSAMNTSKAASQGIISFDWFKGIMNNAEQAASMIGGGLGAGLGGMLGGSPNLMNFDSFRQKAGNAPHQKARDEQAQAAEAKNGAQLKIMVPLQTGINSTVGQGTTVSLIGALGDDLKSYAQNPMSGGWLVKDVCHEIYTDKRERNATTVMQLIRGPDQYG